MADGDNRPWVRGGEDNACGADRDVCTCADGDSGVGLGEGRGVVDTVADHGNGSAFVLKSADLRGLVLRSDAGIDPVDAEFLTNGIGDGLRVAGDHHDLDTFAVESINGCAGFGSNLVGEAEGADDVAVGKHVQDDRALLAPLIGNVTGVQAVLFQEVRAADLDAGAIGGGGFHSDCRGGGEVAGARNVQVTGLCAAGNGDGQRMFAVCFCGGG